MAPHTQGEAGSADTADHQPRPAALSPDPADAPACDAPAISPRSSNASAPQPPAPPAAPAPKPPADAARLTSSDPETLRALAHPLRVEILSILDDVDEATASEIAARTNQTVANCSFHLRTLAKYGFIEACEQRGREKPWRALHTAGRDLSPDPSDALSIASSRSLGAIYVQREAARVTEFLARRDLPAQWIPATTVNTSSFWATAEEMVELVQEVAALTDRFAGRSQNPELRPEGATLGRFFATVNPELGPGPYGDDEDDLVLGTA